MKLCFVFPTMFWHIWYCIGWVGMVYNRLFALLSQTVSWCLADQMHWTRWCFEFLFHLAFYEPINLSQVLKCFSLLMWSADFWLGSVPHHFRSCRNTWQLMGSNLAPSLLVLLRLARHNSSLMVWQPCPTPPRLQLAPLDTWILLWRVLQDEDAPRWSERQQAAVFILLSLQELFHRSLGQGWPLSSNPEGNLYSWHLASASQVTYYELGVYPKCFISCSDMKPSTTYPAPPR